MFMTFHGKTRAPEHVFAHAHELPPVMMVPLYVLAAGALFAGVAFAGSFIGDGYESFWQNAIFMSDHNHIMHEMHDVAGWVPWAPTIAMLLGFLVAYWFYIRSPQVPQRLAAEQEPALQIPAQQVVFRRDLRHDLRAAGEVARALPVEAGRRLADRWLRAGRHLGARP